MKRSTALRMSGFIGTAGLTVALVGAAVGGTGAYFTDSNSGTASGSMGTIRVGTYGAGGADGLDINFTNMLPGTANSQAIKFVNTGTNNQDVWVVFPQAALGDFDHATDTNLINDKGRYGEIHIKAFNTAVFDSNNLNDDPINCPLGASDATHGPCNPLPKQLLLASNLVPNQEGTMDFSYTPGALIKSGQGQPNFSLPYKIVATQHGIAPDNTLNASF